MIRSFTKKKLADQKVGTSALVGRSTAEIAKLVAGEYFVEKQGDSLDRKMSLSSSDETETGTAMTPHESRSSTSMSDNNLAIVVGTRAVEYLEECLSAEVSVLDRDKFHSIREYEKSEFIIAKFLGKGNYSDVFEVSITVPIHDCKHDGDINNIIEQPKLNSNFYSNRTASQDTERTGNGASFNTRRMPSARRASLSSSVTTTTLKRPSRCNECQLVFAMKCLQPQIRSNAEKFIIGAEDLVHETVMLASLDHPNIIKVYGRAAGALSDSFKLNDGYFILLEKLEGTLKERIRTWRKMPKSVIQRPTLPQIDAGHSITNAMAYLHSKNVVFRDLKPANVGFDSHGVLKLFDFGFAIFLPEKDDENPEGHLFDRCGTLRYMAPEVGLCQGYGIKADVYSFGLLFWEICALEEPFADFKSVDDIKASIFVNGRRPIIKNKWQETVKEVITSCWSGNASERPSMSHIMSLLYELMTCMSEKTDNVKNNPRRYSISGRLSWNI